MGRIRFLIFKLSRFIPKKYRKPFILVSSILGLFIFLNIITDISKSEYLFALQDTVSQIKTTLTIEGAFGWSLLFLITLIGYCSFRFYSQLFSIISLCYIVIFILAILPWIT